MALVNRKVKIKNTEIYFWFKFEIVKSISFYKRLFVLLQYKLFMKLILNSYIEEYLKKSKKYNCFWYISKHKNNRILVMLYGFSEIEGIEIAEHVLDNINSKYINIRIKIEDCKSKRLRIYNKS